MPDFAPRAFVPQAFVRRALLAGPVLLAAGRVPAVRAGAARTLAVGIVSDPVTLDPAFAGSFFENQVLYNLHETLLVVQPDGTLMPGLAEDWAWRDPLTLRLSLRAGLRFHDGTVLDAEAVCANIARLTDPATGSIRRADFGPFAGVRAVNGQVVEMTLSEPFTPLPYALAGRAGMIVSPTALAKLGADFGFRAVGCGAFRLVSWTRNAELALEAFPGYWRGAGHGFELLSFRALPDETARLANLRSGTVQLIDAVPPQAVGGLTAAGLHVGQMPSIGFTAFSMNCTRPPFADRRVRQAFVAAIDPEVVHRIVYFGTGRVVHGPISPAMGWAFDPGFAPPGRDGARTRALLTDSGVAVPVAITITVTNAQQMVRTAQVLQAQAADAGFAVTVRQIDPAGLLSVLQKRDFDICMSPWSGRYDPDGNTFLWFSNGAPFNFAGYDSDVVTSLLRQARRTADRGERAGLYRRAQALLAEDAPVLFLHSDAILQASSPELAWTQYPDGAFRLFDAHSL